MPPRVSIGMPVWDAEQFLEEALDCLLAQTFGDLELTISDNASTDRTEQICRKYQAKDRRVHYYRNETNSGAAFNFNRVFRLSKGEYFKWASYDDLCAEEYLARCVEVLDHNPSTVLCYPRTIIIDENGRETKKYFDQFSLSAAQPSERFKHYHKLVRHGHECHPIFGLIRANTLRRTSLIGSYVSSDLVLLGELALHGEFYEIPEWLFFRRNHPQTTIRTYRTYRERISWFDPAKKGRLQMARWMWLYAHLGAINRVNMSWNERALCYGQMGKWLMWNLPWLVKDVAKAVVWPFLRPFLPRTNISEEAPVFCESSISTKKEKVEN